MRWTTFDPHPHRGEAVRCLGNSRGPMGITGTQLSEACWHGSWADTAQKLNLFNLSTERLYLTFIVFAFILLHFIILFHLISLYFILFYFTISFPFISFPFLFHFALFHFISLYLVLFHLCRRMRDLHFAACRLLSKLTASKKVLWSLGSPHLGSVRGHFCWKMGQAPIQAVPVTSPAL